MSDSTTRQPEVQPDSPAAPAAGRSASNGARHDSVRERLRQRRDEIIKDEYIDLLIPSYGGEFAVRYRGVDDEEFDKLVKRIQARGNTESNLNTALDLLARCADCVLVREGEELEPLVDDEELPIAFDIRLAEFFGFAREGDEITVRQIIKEVFSPDGRHPLAPGVHAMAVVDWMQGNQANIDAVLLGE